MDLRWFALSEEDIKRAGASSWESPFDSVAPALRVALRLIRHDMRSFARNSADRVAAWSARAKDLKSVQDKLARIAKELATGVRPFPEGSTTLSLCDLVGDLVGGRQVFYFERDIQDAIIFWMTYPTYYPVDVTHWVQDLSGYDTDLPVARWLKRLKVHVNRRPKESGYESLHMVLGFDVDRLILRCQVAERRFTKRDRKSGMTPELREAKFLVGMLPAIRDHAVILAKLRVEMQCRTILEHAWAEVEHRSRYSIEKAGSTVAALDSGQLRKTFRSYKAVLRSAQIFQNSIRSGFSRWDDETSALLGRSSSVEVGRRAEYWPEEQRERIGEIANSMEAALQQSRAGGLSSDPWKVPWQLFATALADITSRADWEDWLRLDTNLNPHDYKRRRIFVLLMGFLLAYWTPWQRRQVKAVEGASEESSTKLRDHVAETFYRKNLPDPAAMAALPPEFSAVRLYEAVRLYDAFYGADGEDLFLFDPLVSCRAASVHFRHFGSYRRANQLLEEGLVRAQRWASESGHSEWVFSPKYIGRRLIESYWTAFNLDGHRAEDLKNALKATRMALADPGPPGDADNDVKDDFAKLEQKLLSFYVMLSLYAVPVLEGTRNDGWQVLYGLHAACRDKAVRGRLKTLAMPTKSEASSNKTSLRLQAAALILATSAVTAKDAHAIDGLLVWARTLIRTARRNIERKVSDGASGALPFHADIARAVEGLIFGLCTDDHPSVVAAGRRKAKTRTRRRA